MNSTISKISLLLFISLITLSTTCEPRFSPYSEYKPILMYRDVLENSISYSSSKKLLQPGKIYLKGDTIYINEKYKGVHVINNQNPKNPQKVGFIVVPGSIDLAIKENILYIDNSVDLVSIKLTPNLSDLTETKRIRDVFPELIPPDSRELSIEYQKENRPANTLIVGWERIK